MYFSSTGKNKTLVSKTLTSKKCSANRNVAFLKVHKAGSTTVQNLLQRMSLTYDLNPVLPNTNDTRKTNGNYHSLYFQDGLVAKHNGNFVNLIPAPRRQNYNMLFNHAPYVREDWAELLPSSAFYLAIVRDAESRFVSAARFWGLVGNSQAELVSLLHDRFDLVKDDILYDNVIARDFGVAKELFHQDADLVKIGKSLSHEFGLIMVMEYFPESLILLKRRLCWQWKDVVYIPANTGSKVKVRLSSADRQKLLSWQRADVVLYEAAVSKLRTLMADEGEDFTAEVEHFNGVLERVRRYCQRSIRLGELKVEASRWSDSFSVTDHDCRLMRAREYDVHDMLVARAWQKFHKSQTLTSFT